MNEKMIEVILLWCNEYMKLRKTTKELMTALQCEINVVRHAGYNPHVSEAILAKAKLEVGEL